MIVLRRGQAGRVLRIGHRGAAALEPDNTIRAFRRAVELGVDFVEFDVLDLADGTLVLAHSNNLLEISHGAVAGRVGGLALAELRALAPGLLSLEEAFRFFRDEAPDVGLHVDIKCRRHGREVADALRAHALVGRSVVSSFWGSTLREVRSAVPELTVALTYPEDRYGLARRSLLTPFVLPTIAVLARALPRRLPRWLAATGAKLAMLHYAVLSRAAVDHCHARGVAVWTWTVNVPAVLEHVVELGADGVITDDPRIFEATLSA